MIDIKLDENGELVVNAGGDFELVWGDEQLTQEVLFRLKTTKGDWLLSPEIGCDLEDFIGQPNEDVTLASIEQRVINALTFDNLLFFPEVRAISVSANEVFIVIHFASQEDDNRVIQIQSLLDLRKGLVFARDVTKELN